MDGAGDFDTVYIAMTKKTPRSPAFMLVIAIVSMLCGTTWAQSTDVVATAALSIQTSTDLSIGAKVRFQLLNRAAGGLRLFLQEEPDSPAALNVHAIALLLGARKHSGEDPIEMLRRATRYTECIAVRKNLMWAEAAHEKSIKRAKFSKHETYAWHYAVSSFVRALAESPPNSTVKAPFSQMREDGLYRTANVCSATCQEDHSSAEPVDCQSFCDSLGDIKFKMFANGTVEHNLGPDSCNEPGLSLNLFDSAVYPHRDLCHPDHTNARGISPYMDLVMRIVTNYIHQQTPAFVAVRDGTMARRAFSWTLSYGSLFDESAMLGGAQPPPQRRGDGVALTGVQVGALRLLDTFVRAIVSNGIKGDVVEAGVWRGGASIVLAAALQEAKARGKRVWLFDSFADVPVSQSHANVVDEVDSWVPNRYACSKKEVRNSFKRFGLQRKAIFVEGYFNETLSPEKRTQKNKFFPNRLSLLRVDVDSYESTLLVLEAFWDRLSPGGFVIVDDYHLEGCRAAVHEFRRRYRPTDQTPLMFVPIDFVNTCSLDSFSHKMKGLREVILRTSSDIPIDLGFRSMSQVVWWRKL